jgi:hypothetical protein
MTPTIDCYIDADFAVTWTPVTSEIPLSCAPDQDTSLPLKPAQSYGCPNYRVK